MKKSRRERKLETQKTLRRKTQEIRKETPPEIPSGAPPQNVVSIVHAVTPLPTDSGREEAVARVNTTVAEVIPSRPLAETIDANRAFDWRLRRLLLDRLLTPEDLEVMRFSVSLAAFVRSRRRIAPEAINTLRTIGYLPLWDEHGGITSLGHDVWEGFRLRIRTEGAIQRVLNGTIIKNRSRAA